MHANPVTENLVAVEQLVVLRHGSRIVESGSSVRVWKGRGKIKAEEQEPTLCKNRKG